MMQFSIVIPVFNKAGFIQQTLQSVLSQSYNNFEVIIVDDGSIDDSVARIETLADERIKLIRQKNAGVSVARNTGISHANGEWVCFLDADDWYHPDYLSNLSKTIAAHTNFNIVAATFFPLADAPNWQPKVWKVHDLTYEVIDNLPERWMQAVPFFTSSIAVKRFLLQKLQPCFPPGESWGEDLDLWFRLAEQHQVLLILQPLVVYRTEVSTGLSVASKSIEAPFLQRMLQRTVRLPSPLKESTRKFVVHIYCTGARTYSFSGKRFTAFGLLKRSFAIGKCIPRYWVTVLMTMFMPATLIKKWQVYKISKSTTKLSNQE